MPRQSRNTANNDIRRAALLADVRHWEICERLGISEPTLTRWLRPELPEERRRMIMDAINDLAKEV